MVGRAQSTSPRRLLREMARPPPGSGAGPRGPKCSSAAPARPQVQNAQRGSWARVNLSSRSARASLRCNRRLKYELDLECPPSRARLARRELPRWSIIGVPRRVLFGRHVLDGPRASPPPGASVGAPRRLPPAAAGAAHVIVAAVADVLENLLGLLVLQCWSRRRGPGASRAGSRPACIVGAYVPPTPPTGQPARARGRPTRRVASVVAACVRDLKKWFRRSSSHGEAARGSLQSRNA